MTLQLSPVTHELPPELPPNSPNFSPGELEKLFSELGEVIDLSTILPTILPGIEAAIDTSDGRIRDLEQFILKKVVDLLFTPQATLDSKDFQKLLEPCTAILNPPEKLQFLREVASQLLSASTSVELHFTSPPYLLPLPLSTSWIPNLPVTCTIPNAALRVLLKSIFNPNSYAQHYAELIEHVVQQALIHSKYQGVLHEVSFTQHHSQYDYKFSFKDMILLFFSDALAKNAQQHPDRDLTFIYDRLNADVEFAFSNLLLEGHITSTHFLADNLINSDVLSTVLPHAIKSRCDISRFSVYILWLLIGGAITSDRIMLSLIQAVSLLQTSATLATKLKLALNTCLKEAAVVTQSKNPLIETLISMLPPVAQEGQCDTSAIQEKIRKGLENSRHFPSIIFRDLQLSSNINWKKKRPPPILEASRASKVAATVINPKAVSNIVALEKTLLEKFEKEKPRLYFVITQANHVHACARWIFEDIFIEGMLLAWNKLSPLVDKATLVKRFVQMCKVNRHVFYGEHSVYMRDLCCAILGLVPVLGAELLFNDPEFRSIAPALYGTTMQHIHDLHVHAYTPELKAQMLKLIQVAIEHTLRFLGPSSASEKRFADILVTLGASLKQDPTTQELHQALQHFIRPLPEREPRLQCAEMLFRSYLASLRPYKRPPQLLFGSLSDKFLEQFLAFSCFTFRACPGADSLRQFILEYNQDANKHALCITSEEAFRDKEVLKRLDLTVEGQTLPIRGFPNRNRTCFINSSLQALFSSKMFPTLLASTNSLLSSQLARLQAHRDDGEALNNVVNKLFWSVPDLKNQLGQIHDVAPVIEYILDHLGYRLRYQTTYRGLADNRHLTATTETPMSMLQVPMFGMGVTASLQELINSVLCTQEVHDPTNQWKAGPVGQEVPISDYSITHTLLEPLPEMIVVHLKRSRWDKGTSRLLVDQAPILFQDPITIGSSRYTLRSCIHHILQPAHYTAEVYKDGKWYLCDDDHVEQIAKAHPEKAYVYILEKL